MASVTYIGYVKPVSPQLMEDIIAEWEREAKGARARILDHLKTKIPDESAFKAKLVSPAIAKYGDYVNPEYPRSDYALLKFRTKLGRAYRAWDSGISSAFAEGGAFETNVTAKKGKMVNAKYTIGAVGQRVPVGFNAIVKAVMAIVGDGRLPTYIEPDKEDSLDGTPLNVFDDKVVNYVKPPLIASAVRACVFSHYANEAGESDLISDTLFDFNEFASKVIASFKKPEATASFTLEWDSDRIAVKVTTTGTLP